MTYSPKVEQAHREFRRWQKKLSESLKRHYALKKILANLYQMEQ